MTETEIGRFGISMLSIDRYDEAFPQEMLVDHETGVIYVNNDDKHLVSFDEIERLSRHVDIFSKKCINRGFYPDICMVEAKTIEGTSLFPKTFTTLNDSDNINLRDTFMNKKGANKISYSIDCELISIDNLSGRSWVVDKNDIQFELKVLFKYRETTEGDYIETEITKVVNADELPNIDINFFKENPTSTDVDCKINSLRILKGPVNPTGKTFKLIIFSILLGRYVI